MDFNWITWDEVKAGSRYFDSPDVEVMGQALMNEACQCALDDLSGYYNLTMMTASTGVPAQIKRLALLKARELAAIAYFGTPTSPEKNETATYFRDEYKFLLESIRNGFIEVEGYSKKINTKKIMYY